MPITYPLTAPLQGRLSLVVSAASSTAATQSQWTGAQTIFANPGQWWELQVTYPPLLRSQAEAVIAFLLKLNGLEGTFLIDVGAPVPAGVGGGSPTVNGANQTGLDLNVSTSVLSQAAWLKQGDYIQLGSGSAARLYKVLDDVDTDGSGDATLTLWPKIRNGDAPANGASVVVSSAKGLFRLKQSAADWSVDRAKLYGLSFACREKI